MHHNDVWQHYPKRIQMIASAGFSQRNITIAAVSLAMGIGFTQVS